MKWVETVVGWSGQKTWWPNVAGDQGGGNAEVRDVTMLEVAFLEVREEGLLTLRRSGRDWQEGDCQG